LAGAVAHMDAVGTPGSGGTRFVARGAEQARQALAVAEHSVTRAARAVLWTAMDTVGAEETCRSKAC